MKRFVTGALALLALLPGAIAQTPAEVQTSLESTLKGKPMLIRDFLADTEIYYSWQAGQLLHQSERFFALGVFRAESVKVHASHGTVDHVTIKGTRRIMFQPDLTAPDRVIFEVDLRGADQAAIEQLATRLFFPDASSALRMVPPQFAPWVQPRPALSTSGGSAEDWVRIAGKWKQAGAPFTSAKVVFQPEPEFSEEARAQKLAGNVRIALSHHSRGPGECRLAGASSRLWARQKVF